jgi:hypothetical protein
MNENKIGKEIDTIVFINDLHCGSKRGLTPPSFWDSYTSDGVKWLWEKWESFHDEVKTLFGEIDLLISNGDLIDGIQKRSDGVGLITSSYSGQVDIAIEALKPFISSYKKIIRIEGTWHHEGMHQALRILDEHFGIKTPQTAKDALVRDIQLDERAILNVKHQPEGSGTLYKGTSLDREALWATMAETIHGLPKATHIVRAHLHTYASLEINQKKVTLSPCWCFQQPYAIQKKYYHWQPIIGGLVMYRDKRGHCGWYTMPLIFNLPIFTAETYNEI